jgi:uncharacterized coiled-coil DUF342 family protein
MKLEFILDLLPYLIPAITGIAGWLGGKKQQQNATVRSMQETVNMLADKKQQLSEEMDKLREENAQLKNSLNSIKRKYEKLWKELNKLKEKNDETKKIK